MAKKKKYTSALDKLSKPKGMGKPRKSRNANGSRKKPKASNVC